MSCHLLGTGSVLILYSLISTNNGDHEFVENSSIFDSIGPHNIHGIRTKSVAPLDGYIFDRKREDTLEFSRKIPKLDCLPLDENSNNEYSFKLLIFGGHFTSSYYMTETVDLNQNTKVYKWLRNGKSYFRMKDWILDMIWCPVIDFSENIALISFAHLNVLSLINMYNGNILRNINMDGHCIRYSSTFFRSSHDATYIYLVCGTAMENILVYHIPLSLLSTHSLFDVESADIVINCSYEFSAHQVRLFYFLFWFWSFKLIIILLGLRFRYSVHSK